MPSIIITPWVRDSIDSYGDVFPVRHLSFKEGDSYRSLHDRKPFVFDQPLEIRLLVRTWPRLLSARIHVPPTIIEAVRKFLSHYQGQEHTLDCYDFACTAANVAHHDKAYLVIYWKKICPLRRLQPGTVLFLLNTSTQQFPHAAISLGRGLYISVYGKGGDIEVTTLKAMRRSYGAKNIWVVTPRYTEGPA